MYCAGMLPSLPEQREGGATVGAGCHFGAGVVLGHDAVIGDRVQIGNHSDVGGARLEDDVFVGKRACLCDQPHPRSAARRGVVVRRGATIGDGAVVAAGVVVGRHAMVAPGAVVLKEVPSFAFVSGNPARQVGWSCKCGEPLDDALRCECGRAYRTFGNRLEEMPELE
jgi:UDP-2-acetamido-3-amino-2,3-dideoxy-glucuronate N-acetyltransferase